jgi:DNA replication and repair protein RecF
MTLSFFPDHAQAASIYEKAMRDRNRLLQGSGERCTMVCALEAQMAEAGEMITANRRDDCAAWRGAGRCRQRLSAA